MSAKQKWIMAAVGLFFLLVIAGFGYQELKKEVKKQELREAKAQDAGEEKVEEETVKAPDFTVWNQEGEQVTLAELLDGKPGVVNFWTSKCPPCKEEMPEFETAYQEYGEEIQFLMIDGVGCMGETEESGKAYLEEQGFTFPVYFDLDMDAVVTYGIQAFPTTFFIDKDGNIAAGRTGMLTAELLEQGISMIRE